MNKSKITLFFILFFMHSICINIIHPVTTDYVGSLNLSVYYFGFFFSLMSLGQVIGAFIFGFLSDKIGRKWLIVLGIIGYGLAQLGFGFINTYPLLILVFRVIAGIFVSAPNTLFVSMCLDNSTTDKKVKMLSILSFCSILGASVGYKIGGSLYDYLHFSFGDIFISQFSLCIITSLILAIFMKDVIRTKSQEIVKEESPIYKNTFKINHSIVLLLTGLLILTIGQILISKYLDTYIIHIGNSSSTLADYVFATGIVGAISNLVIIPFIKKIKSKYFSYLLISFVLISSILTFITFSSGENIMIFLFTTHMIYSVFKSIITPLEQNELSTYGNTNSNGKLMGIRQTLLSIGNVVGPLLGSIFYLEGDPSVFIISGFIILLSFIIYLIYFLTKKRKAI